MKQDTQTDELNKKVALTDPVTGDKVTTDRRERCTLLHLHENGDSRSTDVRQGSLHNVDNHQTANHTFQKLEQKALVERYVADEDRQKASNRGAMNPAKTLTLTDGGEAFVDEHGHRFSGIDAEFDAESQIAKNAERLEEHEDRFGEKADVESVQRLGGTVSGLPTAVNDAQETANENADKIQTIAKTFDSELHKLRSRVEELEAENEKLREQQKENTSRASALWDWYQSIQRQ